MEKKPLIITLVFSVIMLIIFNVSCNNCSSKKTSLDDKEQTSTYTNYDTPKETKEEKIELSPEMEMYKDILKFISDYSVVSAHIPTINPDASTESEDDNIVLIDMTFESGKKTAVDIITMCSEDLAVKMANAYPNINELVLLWSAPNVNNGSAKLSFERDKNGKMIYIEKIFDSNF